MNDRPLDPFGPALSELPRSDAAASVRRLIRRGSDRLPLPGRGQTLARWRALAGVAELDLSTVKLFEAHVDALAILEELGDVAHEQTGRLWAVWTAEGADRLRIDTGASGGIVLCGQKSWCSGAADVTDALVTAWLADGSGPQLVHVELAGGSLRVDAECWQGLGMAGSAPLTVHFDGTPARLVGKPGDYLSRPGFWHGGAGIAACWYGATAGVATHLRGQVRKQRPHASPFQLAALGKVDTVLAQLVALMRTTADWIDRHPERNAQVPALRIRLAADGAATRVLKLTGEALGPTPYCRDRHYARLAADLPVFVRQSHADRDFAALADAIADEEEPWML